MGLHLCCSLLIDDSGSKWWFIVTIFSTCDTTALCWMGLSTTVRLILMRRATDYRLGLAQFLFAGCLSLSSAVSSQFTLEVCASADNRKKIRKKSENPLFGEFEVI